MAFVVQKPQAGPAWASVVGGRVLFAPIDRALVRRARRAAIKALGRDEHGPEAGGDAEDVVVQLEDLGDALSHAMILEGALDWEGGEQRLEDGSCVPLPFSREALSDMLADPVYFDALDAAYVVPYAMREREKNVSAVSPTGTGEAETPASDTASKAATPTTPAVAPPARTGRKPRAPKKQKASGTS